MPETYENLILAAYYGKPEDIRQLLLRNADLSLYADLVNNPVKVDAIKASLYSSKRSNLQILLKNCTFDQLWSTDSKSKTSFELAGQFGQTDLLFDLIMRAIEFLDQNEFDKFNFIPLAQIIINSSQNFSEQQIEQISKFLHGRHKATVFLGLVNQNRLLPIKIFLENGADVNTAYIRDRSALQVLLSLPDMDIQILDLFTAYNVNFNLTPQGTKPPIEYCRNPTIREYFIKISNPDFQKSAIKDRETRELRNKEEARAAEAKYIADAKEADAQRIAAVQAAAERRECLYNFLSCGLLLFWKNKNSTRKSSLEKQDLKIPNAVEAFPAANETVDHIPSATVVSTLKLI